MSIDPSRMCELLVGLDDIEVISVTRDVMALTVTVRSRKPAPTCEACEKPLTVKDRDRVDYVDLPAFGQPVVLRWDKRRFDGCCGQRSRTEVDPLIAAPAHRLTTRAGRWATEQVGKHRRSVSSVAEELRCDWHTINDAVIAYGQALLDADTARVASIVALGLDETLFARIGRYRTRRWATTVADLTRGVLVDVIAGRDAVTVTKQLDSYPKGVTAPLRYASIDLSGPYRVVIDTLYPEATVVADRFHVIKNANARVDDARRRIQNQRLGHRGRKGDPLYGIRRLLVTAEERLDPAATHKLRDKLALGDPASEIDAVWAAKEALRDFYRLDNFAKAETVIDEITKICLAASMPPETKRLGRMLKRWRTEILNWYRVQISNGPTEGLNNMIKLAKRIAFGFRSFTNFRIRALLYAGKPNWSLLQHLNPAEIR